MTSTGGIAAGRTGEVMVAIRGGVEAFLARDIDGGAIGPTRRSLSIDYVPPRLVLVTPLTEES